jgi:hypothetical protein
MDVISTVSPADLQLSEDSSPFIIPERISDLDTFKTRIFKSGFKGVAVKPTVMIGSPHSSNLWNTGIL